MYKNIQYCSFYVNNMKKELKPPMDHYVYKETKYD